MAKHQSQRPNIVIQNCHFHVSHSGNHGTVWISVALGASALAGLAKVMGWLG